jgi:hypothetical protein
MHVLPQSCDCVATATDLSGDPREELQLKSRHVAKALAGERRRELRGDRDVRRGAALSGAIERVDEPIPHLFAGFRSRPVVAHVLGPSFDSSEDAPSSIDERAHPKPHDCEQQNKKKGEREACLIVRVNEPVRISGARHTGQMRVPWSMR